MVKVLHLLQSNRFSGAENVVCQIISMMKDNPDIEMVYCSRDGEIREALKERNIKFLPISNLKVSEVKRVIREYNPDVIHAHDFNAAFNAALVCGKKLLVVHVHFNDAKARKLSVKSVASLIPILKAKHIFWVSESSLVQHRFKKAAIKKSQVLYNIIDIDTLYKKMESDANAYDFDVVYVGRLVYQKHPERLIEVIAKAVQKKSDLKVAVVGNGALEETTKKLATEMNLEKNITFFGFQSNPLKILYSSKLMLMTSRYEGTPMCALEAMALGVPIVTTPTDGLCELVDDGVNGYISNQNDVLADRIIQIATQTSLRGSFSENAHNKCKNLCNVEKYRDNIIASYEE